MSICPAGWHIPSFEEWNELVVFAGNVGYWWTSTENANYYVYCYDMVYNREYTNYSISCEKSMLYSVRCVKD
jgi:uncharacterized protein (TIGR02145 family)